MELMDLPSKYMKTPSFRRHGFLWRTMTAGMTFFLRSGFPFFTVAITMSPTQAAGRRFRRPFTPFTEITYRFFAPVLSAQFTTAPTGSPRDIRNLLPEDPPRPIQKRERKWRQRVRIRIKEKWILVTKKRKESDSGEEHGPVLGFRRNKTFIAMFDLSDCAD